MFQFWMNMSPFGKGMVIGGAAGVTTVVVCGAVYHFYDRRERKALSRKMIKMLEDASASFEKLCKKGRADCCVDLKKAAVTLASLNWKKGEVLTQVNKLVDCATALHNHHLGVAPLPDATLKKVLRTFEAASGKLLAKKPEEDKEEKEAE